MSHPIKSRPRRGVVSSAPRSDLQFTWASKNPTLDRWRTALAQWVTTVTGKRTAVDVGNAVLDYVASHPDRRLTPALFCHYDYANPVPLVTALTPKQRGRQAFMNALSKFFDWYVKAYLSVAIDRHGEGIGSADHGNPIARVLPGYRPSESTRDAMPTRYLRELRTLLMENDWAWAKQQAEHYVEVQDAETDEVEKVWCPVAAYALAFALFTPLRTMQIRMLDSGEGDTKRRCDGHWVANTTLQAPPPGRCVQNGFLRPYRDEERDVDFVGMHVSVNKTGKRRPGTVDPGYDVAWVPPELVEITDRLVAWQERYNPVNGPTAFTAVRDKHVRLSGNPRPGEAFFLFRDPLNSDRSTPVDYHVLWNLWNKLVAAVEDRLAARGQKVQLTKRSADGRTRTSRFNLHSLRVTMLTALATDGQLPLQILQRLAGHSTLVMTLYYVRTDGVRVAQEINDAWARVAEKETEQFIEHLAADVGKGGFVSTDAAGTAALHRTDAGQWISTGTGICPVGGARCGDGGSRIGKNQYGPVPGGPRNCVQCRFHVSGPAFLPALAASFNDDMLSLVAARQTREKATAEASAAEQACLEIRPLPDEGAVPEINTGNAALQIVKQRRQEQKLGTALTVAQDRQEQAELRCVALEQRMIATGRLAAQCETLCREGKANLHLVLQGSFQDIQVAVKDTTQFDLLDRVCQAAELYASSNAKTATLERSQVLDRVLMRENGSPVLMHLEPEVQRKAGNEMMRLLASQSGSRDDAVAWVSTTTAGRVVDVADVLREVERALPAPARSLPGPARAARQGA